ncbi:MAG: WG repeat-containing protein [Bryobacteraceae bacterium]|jgi:WD40 repeat protein
MCSAKVLLVWLSCSTLWAAGGPAVRSLAFAEDGENLVAGYEDGRVLVWTVGGPREAARWEGHKDSVYAVAVVPGGKLVATGSGDGSIGLWSWPEGWRVATLEGHKEAVLALAATPDGKILASGSGDATIKLWAMPGGRLLGTLEGHRESVLSLAVSPDGKRLASGSADAEIGLWSLPEGKLLGQMKRGKFKSLKSGIVSVSPGAGNATAIGVRALAFSPDGAELYSSGLEIKRAPGEPARGAVRVWSVESRTMERVFKEHLTMVTSLAASPDGKTLISGSSDRTAKLYPLPGGEGPATLLHDGTVYAVAVSPDGKTIATGDSTGAVRLWELGGKSPKSTLRDPAPRQEGSSLWRVESPDRKTPLEIGFVDRAGSSRIAPRFDEAGDFSEDLALVKLRKQSFFVDPAGKEAIPLPAGVNECDAFREGLARIKKGKLIGFIDKTGRTVIEPQFSEPKASERSLELGGAAAVPLFSTASPGFFEGLAVFEKERKQGYIDQNGKVVIPAQFDYASGFREGLALIGINGKWGFVDPGGRLAIPAQYDEGTHFSQGLAAVRSGRRWSYVDRAGETVLAVEFDEARAFSEDLAAVRQGKLWGYIDRTGRLAIQPRFSAAWEFQEGRALVADKTPPNWDFGFINRAGKLIDTLWARWAGDFRGGLARVEVMYSRSERHDSVLIDRTGVIVIDPRALVATRTP